MSIVIETSRTVHKESVTECHTLDKCNKCFKVQWLPPDYTLENGFPLHTNFTDRGLFFNSRLATDGVLYTAPLPQEGWTPPFWRGYYFDQYNVNVEFDKPNPGIPMAHPYVYEPPRGLYPPLDPLEVARQYKFWGGDDKFAGRSFYADEIATFGHKHILSVMTKIQFHLVNPNYVPIPQDLMLQSLLGGSGRLFSIFSQIVDENGNFVPIDISPSAGIVDQIKYLCRSLIYGQFTVEPNRYINPDGSINTSNIIAVLSELANGNTSLTDIIEELIKFLTYITRQGKPTQVELYPWVPMMTMHQGLIYDVYLANIKYFRTSKCSCEYKAVKKETNRLIRQLLDDGNQMAGFYGLFISLLAFLDTWLTINYPDAPKPNAINEFVEGNPILTCRFVQSESQRYWTEHVTGMVDYCRVVACNKISEEVRGDLMYQLQTVLLFSCGGLASNTIGKLFEIFDTLVRRRQLYITIA